MTKREIENLDLKIKILREYLDNGGLQKIQLPRFLEDLTKIKYDKNGKVDPNTVSSIVGAMMSTLLMAHLTPPFLSPEYISEYRSTLQKANSFDQENIDTKEQFDKIYDEYSPKTDMLFRGQREAKWRLYSKLQRQWIIEKLSTTEKDYQSLLKKMIENGRSNFGKKIKELLSRHHIDSDNDVSVLGFLQHHGCPTPLLDWTYKFQNALFFSIDGLVQNSGTIEIDDYFSVFYIEEKHFKGSNLRAIINDGLDELEEPELQKLIDIYSNGDEKKKQAMQKHFAGRKVFDRSKLTGSGLISHMTKIETIINVPIGYFSDNDSSNDILFSLNNSQNILNQAGVFTWNADPTKPLEIVGDELYREGKNEDEEINYRFCTCFNINKKLELHIRERLEKDGITRDFIYPTPDISTWDTYMQSKNNGT